MAGQLEKTSAQSSKKTIIANRLQFLIGIFSLLLGSLVYVIDRVPEQIYFTSFFGINSKIVDSSSNILVPFSNSLPAFLHILALSLITASFFKYNRKIYIIICAGWVFIDCCFEVGQKYKDSAINIVPDFFNNIPFLENTKNYFQYGLFDPLDLIAYILGGITGYFILIFTAKYNNIQQ